jgi:hypothetical protein
LRARCLQLGPRLDTPGHDYTVVLQTTRHVLARASASGAKFTPTISSISARGEVPEPRFVNFSILGQTPVQALPLPSDCSQADFRAAFQSERNGGSQLQPRHEGVLRPKIGRPLLLQGLSPGQSASYYHPGSLPAPPTRWPTRIQERHFPFLRFKTETMSSGFLQSTLAGKMQPLSALWHTPLWISNSLHTKQSRVPGVRLREIG